MKKPAQPNMTKTCVNCGQQKPLSAFLEMSGTQGTAYGSVCSACRKTALEAVERRKKTDSEGSTTSETGHKIDSKSKIHGEIDRREQRERIDEDYHEERKLDEVSADEKQEIKQQAEVGQKKHREEFLKKRTVLSGDKKAGAAPGFLQKQQVETTNRALRDNENIALQAQGVQEDRIKTEHDFTVANQGQQITGQLRFSGQTFQQFRQWLGNAAPIVHNVNQTKKEAAAKQPGAVAEPVTKAKEKVVTKDPAVEFVEKNWRPGSKR